jgi:hypothetical protein
LEESADSQSMELKSHGSKHQLLHETQSVISSKKNSSVIRKPVVQGPSFNKKRAESSAIIVANNFKTE